MFTVIYISIKDIYEKIMQISDCEENQRLDIEYGGIRFQKRAKTFWEVLHEGNLFRDFGYRQGGNHPPNPTPPSID